MALSDQQWREYLESGYLRLGRVADPAQLAGLQERINEIMLGQASVRYDKMLMQLDSADGNYASAPPQSLGFKGATLNYRKIEGLEYEPRFLEYMQHPVFEDIARQVYPGTDVGCFRSMFMNKPASGGTELPLHQDRWKALDRDPLLTVYTALDDHRTENGCVELIPGSHWKLLNPDHPSGFLTTEMSREQLALNRFVPLELDAGEVAILHNWTLHRSGVNRTGASRRAFSVCLMDADTVNLETGRPASRVKIFTEP